MCTPQIFTRTYVHTHTHTHKHTHTHTYTHTHTHIHTRTHTHTNTHTKGWPEPHIYGLYTVFLAGKSPNKLSCTVYIYGSGRPQICTPMLSADVCCTFHEVVTTSRTRSACTSRPFDGHQPVPIKLVLTKARASNQCWYSPMPL
jgi:hypothetical protein